MFAFQYEVTQTCWNHQSKEEAINIDLIIVNVHSDICKSISIL